MASQRESGRARANLEIKARCADLDAVRERASRIATQRVGVDRQVDTYFRTRSGRLKLRESSLYGGQLVPYLRPDERGPKLADYRVVPVQDASGLKALLSEMLGVHRVVEKQREIFFFENVRIHLDRVRGLGSFVELEAVFDGSRSALAEQRRKLDFLMREIGVREEDLVSASYEGLVEG